MKPMLILIITLIAVYYVRDTVEILYTLNSLDEYVSSHNTLMVNVDNKFFIESNYRLNPKSQAFLMFIKDTGYKSISVDELSAVQVAFAAPGKELDELFGHTFLRLTFCDGRPKCSSEIQDISFSFEKKWNGSGIPGFRNLFGSGYQAVFNAHDSQVYANRYLRHGRAITYFDLYMKNIDQSRLIPELVRLSDQFIIGDWSFPYRGCNYYLQSLLNRVLLLKPRPSRSLTFIAKSPIELLELIFDRLGVGIVYHYEPT